MIIHKFLTGLLILTFTALVLLFTYKTFVNPEIVKADIKNIVTEQSEQEKNDQSAKDEEEKMAKEFDAKIKNYILNHPEDIVKSLEGLQQKKIIESSKKSEHYLKDNRAMIETEGIAPMIGSYDADVTIVMFYDYNCSYCKRGSEALEQVMETDKRIKVILRPIPILGGTSLYVAKVSLAVHKIAPEKFQTIHRELMQLNAPITEASAKDLIAKHDIDYAMVENEINSYSIRELINKNLDFAQNIDLKGAPSYVINGQFFPGLLDANRLKSIITSMREQH
jgi:protein-disulfide isomerase